MSLLARVGAFLKRPFRRDALVSVTNLNGETRTGHVSGWPPGGRIRDDMRMSDEPVRFRGDIVPHIHGHSSYSIQTKEGWWVNVAQGRIQDWSVKPTMWSSVQYNGTHGGALRGYRRTG